VENAEERGKIHGALYLKIQFGFQHFTLVDYDN
jgi:hypothetical protein